MVVARWGLLAAAGAAIVWVIATTPTWHGLLLEPATHFLFIVIAGALAHGLLLPTSLGRATAWSTLAIVGHVTALQLIEAGTLVVYPHWRPAVAPLTAVDGRILIALAAQAVLVAAGLVSNRRLIAAWVRSHLGWGRTVILVAVVVVLGASPMKDLEAYAGEMALAGAVGLMQLGAVILAALTLEARPARWLERRLERLLGGRPSVVEVTLGAGQGGLFRFLFADRVALGAALFVLVVSAFLASSIWERHPHIADEVSYLFQARYFAAGLIEAPGVPVPEAFMAYLISCTEERCISVSPGPGWPVILAIGYRLGAPWLLNPLLAALGVLLAFAFLTVLYGRRFGRAAALLLAASPWYLFLAMSFMNHIATLAAASLAALGTILAWRRREIRWAILTGLGAGVAALIRPLSGVVVGASMGAILLFTGPPGRRVAAAALCASVASLIASVSLAYNARITGHALGFPMMSYMDAVWGEGADDLGFGANRGFAPKYEGLDALPGHTPIEALGNAVLNTTAIEFDLYGWALGSLMGVILLVLLGRVVRRDLSLLLVIFFVVVCYSFYWFAGGPDFGARYWALSIVPLVALTARGLQELRGTVSSGEVGSDLVQRGRVAWGAGLLVLVSLLVFLPWRGTDKYHGYWDMKPIAREWIRNDVFGDDIVLIRGRSQPDYSSALLHNPLDVRAGSGPVFAHDSTAGTLKGLATAFPDRRIWLVEGPSVLEGYRIRGVMSDGTTGNVGQDGDRQ